jgi:pantetheine-phosphate adenylyltransferase
MVKVAVGGTFDRLHKGHRKLFEQALKIGDYLVVGLTSDEMIDKPAGTFEDRKGVLERFLGDFPHEILRIEDPLGPAVSMKDLRYIVVSEETMEGAVEINEKRERKGLAPLVVSVVPMVLAEDGKPISSSRIRAGEIDGEGKVL